jgi:ATP-dependent helicase HrpA
MREWADIHLQLLELAGEAGMKPGPRRNEYDPIHRAILTGLLSSVALRGEGPQYTAAGGRKAILWPGSGIFASKPQWIVAAEVVETTNRYLRSCARIDPRWIEPLAGHLVNRSYSEIRWDRASASAVALEKVSLYGLPVVAGRRVRYGPVDPATARELLIRHGLVEGQIDFRAAFFEHNRRLLEEMERLAAKLRRNDLLLPDSSRFEFYDRRIPEDVYDGPRLSKWLAAAEQHDPRVLFMSKSDLVADESAEVAKTSFPDALTVAGQRLGLEYRFEPGAADDGVTLRVPVEMLGQVDAEELDWGVPGLLEPKIVALIRALPKEIRRHLVPAPQTAKKALELIRFGEGDFLAAVARALGRVSGQRILPSAFDRDKLPQEVQMNVRVMDASGQTLAAGRDLHAVRRQLGQETAARIASLADPRWTRDGIRTWDFDQLPEHVEIRRGRLAVKAYPMLVDSGRTEESVALGLADTPERAVRETRRGLRRLFAIAASRELRTQAQWLPNRQAMDLHARALAGFDFVEDVAELIADRALAPDASIPRNRGEFDAFVAAARARIGLAVQDVAQLLGPLFETYHRARLALEQNQSPRWQYALDDIRAQLDRLTPPRFLVLTPWEWLQHYPRYFRAIPIRLDAIRGGGLARDREHCELVQARWQAYAQRAAEHEQLGVDDPELARYRWMLEEYRVSLFAQRLRTAIPVSAKRLDQQWGRVR